MPELIKRHKYSTQIFFMGMLLQAEKKEKWEEKNEN